jgi:hypothetical protein
MSEDLDLGGFHASSHENLAALVAFTLHVLVTVRQRSDLMKIVLADGTGDLAVHAVSDANMDDEGCRISESPITVDLIKLQEQ